MGMTLCLVARRQDKLKLQVKASFHVPGSLKLGGRRSLNVWQVETIEIVHVQSLIRKYTYSVVYAHDDVCDCHKVKCFELKR